ncbi:unnamed protein product [Peniophora sp. CBMAI 1063]|nr:unnamed protein product [Peniophora sp. CBMAI 1063]
MWCFILLMTTPRDVEIVKADQEGYIRSYIVLPSTSCGILTGPVADANIEHIHSRQIPEAIVIGMKHSRTRLAAAIWSHSVRRSTVQHHRAVEASALDANGHYGPLKRDGSISLCALQPQQERISQAHDIHERRHRQVPRRKRPPRFNFKCRAVRAEERGWNPRKTTGDFYEFIPSEVVAMVKDPFRSRRLPKFIALIAQRIPHSVDV